MHNLATGDGKEAAHALLRVWPPGGITGYGLQFGVLCREQAPFTDLERVRAAAKEALPDFPDPVLALLPRSRHFSGLRSLGTSPLRAESTEGRHGVTCLLSCSKAASTGSVRGAGQ